jgi:ArsR family transcriptional regulator
MNILTEETIISSLTQEVNQLHADICSALADPNRILILYLLASQPYTVNQLSAKLSVSQPTTSRHLKILKERGLVHATRLAQNVTYTLVDNRIILALDTLRAVLRDTLSQRANLVSE